MRISDWSSDVCSSDLLEHHFGKPDAVRVGRFCAPRRDPPRQHPRRPFVPAEQAAREIINDSDSLDAHPPAMAWRPARSEEHTSELQSLMRISYAVFCMNKKKTIPTQDSHRQTDDNTIRTLNHVQLPHVVH